MSISRSVHRVLVGMLLVGLTVAAAADEPYYLLPNKLLTDLGNVANVPPSKIAVVIVIDENGNPEYLFPVKPVYGKGSLPKRDSGGLLNLDSIAIAVTSKSPNCVWVKGGGGWYLVCL